MTSSPTLPASSNGLSRKFPMAVKIYEYSILAKPLQINIILFLLNILLRENLLKYYIFLQWNEARQEAIEGNKARGK